MAYPIDKYPDAVCGDVLVNYLYYWQRRDIFQAGHNVRSFQFYASVQRLNLTNLSVRLNAGDYEVTFFHDEQRSGKPVRRGHNKDYHNIDSPLYRHDVLNETAFLLKQAQYGRIIWNERKLDYDTGEWYYQLHVINLLHYLGEMLKSNIFLNSKPDFEYKQMAVLY